MSAIISEDAPKPAVVSDRSPSSHCKDNSAQAAVKKRQPWHRCGSIRVWSFLRWAILLVGLPRFSTARSSSDIERGKNIRRLAASDLHNAFVEIREDFHEKAFGSRHGWKILNVKDGIEIALLEHPSDPSCPYVRMKARMPVSVQECWHWLRVSNWDRTMKIMDPFYEGVSVHGEYHHKGTHMLLARKRTKRILTFGKRDFVFLSVSDAPMADGTWVSGTVSVYTPNLPRQRAYTRAFQNSIAFYKPRDKGETDLTIVCRIDLNDPLGAGGSIPMWLYVKTIGTTGVRSVAKMRQALMEEHEEFLAHHQQQQHPRFIPKSFQWANLRLKKESTKP